MMNSDLTRELLQQLESDPQLQSIEKTILNDEQYPIAFESSKAIPNYFSSHDGRMVEKVKLSLKSKPSICGYKDRKPYAIYALIQH
jgi:hypothetical protein